MHVQERVAKEPFNSIAMPLPAANKSSLTKLIQSLRQHRNAAETVYRAVTLSLISVASYTAIQTMRCNRAIYQITKSYDINQALQNNDICGCTQTGKVFVVSLSLLIGLGIGDLLARSLQKKRQ